MIKLFAMKNLIVFIAALVISISCTKINKVKELKGYVVYKLPNYLIFVETKGKPDTNYINEFVKENFLQGIWFRPNCEIEQVLGKIKTDSLLNEDPAMEEYSIFLKDPLIFPAAIKLIDTCSKEQQRMPTHKFKMIYKGKPVEFNYKEFNGVVIDIKRTQ